MSRIASFVRRQDGKGSSLGPVKAEEDTTMRFLMLIYPDIPQTDDKWIPSADTLDPAMGRYNKELSEAGVLLAVDGLLAPDRGARIHFNGPASTAKDGPFTEAKEIVGGFWIIDCTSKDEAVEWAKRCPCGGDTFIELRQIAGEAPFRPEVRAAKSDRV
jgi:hypothetical protein